MPYPSVSALWPSFHALEWFTIPTLGRCATVLLDRDTSDFAHLIGCEVLIDGRLYRCRSVERFLHSPPWHMGETVSLLVEEV